ILERYGYSCYVALPNRLTPVAPEEVQVSCVVDYLAVRELTGRWSAWLTYGMTFQERKVRALVECDSPRAENRAWIAASLAYVEDELAEDSAIVEALGRLREDPDANVRRAAAWADAPRRRGHTSVNDSDGKESAVSSPSLSRGKYGSLAPDRRWTAGSDPGRRSMSADGERRQKTVILYGNDPSGPTGFGRVVAHLVDAVTCAGHRPLVVPLKAVTDRPSGAEVLVPPETDPRGWQTLQDAVMAEHAPMVISVGDPWDIQGLALARQECPFTWIGYTPVDSTPYPRYVLLTRDPHQYMDVLYAMLRMDQVVTFTDFGAVAVADMLQEAPPGQSKPPVRSIPLGVNPEVFSPQPRIRAREVFSGGVGSDVLLFSCVKVSSARAGFDTLLAAWARYLQLAAEHDPDLAARSKLYLHTALEGEGSSVPLLMKRYGIQHTLLLNPALSAGVTVSDEDMAQIYASSDVVLSAARAEGFGLNILEPMSCGIPCIVPDQGGPAEFGGDGVVRIAVAARYTPEFAVTDFCIVDVEQMAHAMLELARDDQRRAAMGASAHRIARELIWTRFTERWAALIEHRLAVQ
ncbi:glycosyltransferase family 4 protein, partial [Planctomycetota bacterium]